MQDEVGDQRFLECRRKALDQLRRKTPDEADGVCHEVTLPVVLECPGCRIECFEETIVDCGAGSRQAVQQRRLPDVRVPGQRDGRHARPPPLLAACRSLTAECPQAALDEGNTGTREPPVAFELAFPRPPRPDPAAQALEVLPHPSHAREVVLELRQLDLELPFSGSSMLGEDVEDQLRAVDDARLEGVLERALLRRAQLFIDEEHLR